MTVLQRNVCRETQGMSRRGRKWHYLCVMFHLSQLHLFIPFPVPPVIKVHRQPHWLQEESAERHGAGSTEVRRRAWPCAQGHAWGKEGQRGCSLLKSTSLMDPSPDCHYHSPQRFARNLLSPKHNARHCKG